MNVLITYNIPSFAANVTGVIVDNGSIVSLGKFPSDIPPLHKSAEQK
jgi:hypothetical protein